MEKTFSVYRSSAGSGKTRTLAKAWLKLALQFRNDYFKHILAVTFTNKASQEMKDRILEYLDTFARGEPSSLADELQTELSMDAQTFRQHSQETQSILLHQYDTFSVSTIDAFFQKVIRSFTREAGLVGDYRLEVDQDAVLEEVIDNLIDELGENRELTDWVVEFARENLENERSWDVRHSLIEFAKEIFREEFKEIEDVLLEKTKTPGYFVHLIRKLKTVKFEFINFIKSRATQALELIHERNLTAADFKYAGGGAYSFFVKASAISSVRGFDEERKGKRPENEYQVPENWPAKSTRSAGVILELSRARLIALMNEILAYWHQHYVGALSAETVLSNFYSFGLIADISRKLKEYKDENNLMLLADAPKFLNGVIRDTDTPFIYEKVGSFYRNYLIDEFQDTSGLQWQNFQPLIVNSLDQGYPSLVVGDVKQAIYRWRGGDLNLLQEKIIGLIGSQRTDIRELDNNFRSASGIVSFNNALFKCTSRILSLESGVPLSAKAYEDVAQKPSRTEEGFVEIRFLRDEKGEGVEGPEPLQTWKDQALAQLPRTLEKLQEQGAALKDIAILVRKNDEGQKIAAYLLQYKDSDDAKPGCSYDVVSNESLRIDGASSVNLLLGAMGYLLNAEDSIARAQLGYEYARLHEPDRKPAEVFIVSRQSVFENNLPDRFTREKTALKKLPLIELTETLIDIFRLGHIAGELVYLQAFQDLVLEFHGRERNDLGAFLEWWQINKHKKSIQLSGDVDAVQILTIHKSKGLQFKYVIIPFCSWSLDHEPWQAPNLWVNAKHDPFKDAGYVPVKYSSTLEKTYFSAFYTEERMKIFLDNLNLLYVAFTRAESGLLVCAPDISNRATKGSVAGLLYRGIQEDEELLKRWSESDLTWRSGEWNVSAPAETGYLKALHLHEYLVAPWREKLVIRQSGASWFEETNEEQKDRLTYGIHMHAVLSRMQYKDETQATLSRIVEEGLITDTERMALEGQLAVLMENSRVADWFGRHWEVRTEVPILSPGGEESRVDRLLMRDKKAVVVDFKTGVPHKRDEKQVSQYMETLRQMNFLQVEGYLLYLGKNEIVEVRSGSRHKAVVKNKNQDQLDLGL